MSWNIFGHDWAVEFLQAHVASKQLRHAYLFTGPPGVGRRTLALRLAQAANCLHPPSPGNPCLQCRACTLFTSMTHPDLTIVQAEEIGGVVKIEQIRELQHGLALAPYEATYRIALLLRFEEAHINAANALLKTLEEPPERVILLLTADSPDNIPATIVSRCETQRLRSLPTEQVAQVLFTNWNVEQEQAHLLANLASGNIGQAVHLLEFPESLDRRKEWLSENLHLLKSGIADRFISAEILSQDKATLQEMLAIWTSFWRDVLIVVSRANTPLSNLDYRAEILQVGAALDIGVVHRVLAVLTQTQIQISRNINSRLALETFMLDLPFL